MNLRPSRSLLALAAAALLAGCATIADEPLPTGGSVPAAYKEAPAGWVDAAPADALSRGPWWTLFGDPTLDALAARLQADNQNLAAFVAAYDQSRALVREQRSALFPLVGVDAGATRSGGGGTAAGSRGTRYDASLGASWEPDLWGRLRRGVEAAGAQAEASAADLASARLSLAGELATNYFSLRETDAEAALLRTTIEAYDRSLQIAQNRYAAGVAPRSDVLQAQTQAASARAELAGLERQRAQLEHAIAVLVGVAPAELSLAAAPWNPEALPALPLGLPSTLLQRRPDIAAAERRVASANAQIGIARAALFPSVSLSASLGSAATRFGDLFSAGAWSFGLSLAQTIFDAGARDARIEQARAGWRQTVATYRQTVLTAFQEVEDQLAAARVLEQQFALRREASQAADLTEEQVMNRYRAGQVSYSEVVAAQVTALNARRTLAQLTLSRQTTAVALIQALGGGYAAP